MSSSTEPPSKRRKVANAGGIDSQLTDEDLLKLFETNLGIPKRIWKEQIRQPWKDVVVPTSIGDIKSLEMEDYQRNSVNSLNVSHLNWRQLLHCIIDRIGGQLESFRFTSSHVICGFGVEEMTLLKRQCPNLKSFGLANAQISPKALGQLGTNLSQLESFAFFYNRPNAAIQRSLADAVASMPHLKEMNVNGSFDGSYLLQLRDSVVSVVIGDTLGLEMANLRQFIRSHQGLKRIQMSTGYKTFQFRLVSEWISDGNYEKKCREAIGLLAQFCPQLEDLTITKRVHGDDYDDDMSLANAFLSLKELKKVEFDRFGFFNLAALKSLCATNCQNLELLWIRVNNVREFGSAETFVHMGKLKKLKSLKMNLPVVDDGHTVALWSGIGATLEYLDIRDAEEVTDASLLQIGRHCSCLAHLVMTKGYNSTFTTEGLVKNLIKKIVKHPSWEDPLMNRRLRIDVFYPRDAVGPDPIQTILDWYEGRVKINTIEYVEEY